MANSSNRLNYSLGSHLWLTVALFATFIFFLVLAIGFPAKKFETKILESQHIRDVSGALKRISSKLNTNPRVTQLYLTEQEIQSFTILAQKTYKKISARSTLKGKTAQLELIYPIDMRVFSFNVFLSVAISESKNNINWSHFRIGKLPIPPIFADILFKSLLSRVVGKEYSSNILRSLEEIKISKNRLYVTLSPTSSFEQNLSYIAKQLRTLSGNNLVLNEPLIYQYLTFLSNSNRINSVTPLHLLLKELILESASNADSYGRLHRNEHIAALVALGLYTEPQYFRHMVSKQLAQAKRKRNLTVTLNGRKDLARHFIVSSTLKLLTDNGLTEEIGEFKELLDSLKGGSGFSFNDIAADRAGIMFAQTAVSAASKLHVFMLKSRLSDTDFLPPFTLLDEGISDKDFKSRYNSTSSVTYKKLIHKIDEELNHQPLYKLI